MESFTNLKNSLVTLSTEHLIKTCHKKRKKKKKEWKMKEFHSFLPTALDIEVIRLFTKCLVFL